MEKETTCTSHCDKGDPHLSESFQNRYKCIFSLNYTKKYISILHRNMYKNQPYYIKTNNVYNQKRVSTMIYYLFPRASIQINVHTKPTFVSSTNKPESTTAAYSNSLYKYLTELQSIVNKVPHWNAICEKSHPLHGISNVARVFMVPICYEILELYYLMHFSWENFTKVNSLHLGNPYTVPVIQHIRKHNPSDVFHIVDESPSLNLFLSFTRSSIDLAFCDAYLYGNNEYRNALQLIMQLCVVFCTQKRKGTCLVKYGDCFTKLSLDALALLSHFYDKVYFVKPSVCLPTSGEKYLVCKGFLYDNIGDKMYQTFFSLYKSLLECPCDKKVDRILLSNMPMFLWSKLEEINSIFGQPRLEQMHQLLVSSENPDWEYEVHDYQKCQEWCAKHKI